MNNKFPPFDTIEDVKVALETSSLTQEYGTVGNNASTALHISLECLSKFHLYVSSCSVLIFQRLVDKRTPKSPKLQASFSLLSGIATDIASIEMLIKHGFDIQAKVLLRSLREKVDFLVYVQLDRAFAIKFVNCDSVEDSNRFWHKHAAKGRLIKAISRRLTLLSAGNTPIIDQLWVDERKRFELWLGQAVHPSHTTGLLSAFPDFGDDEWGRSDKVGIVGAPTDNSVVTARAVFALALEITFLIRSRSLVSKDVSTQPMQEGGSELEQTMLVHQRAEHFIYKCLSEMMFSPNIDILRLMFFMRGYELCPIDGTFDANVYKMQVLDTLIKILEHGKKTLSMKISGTGQ